LLITYKVDGDNHFLWRISLDETNTLDRINDHNIHLLLSQCICDSC